MTPSSPAMILTRGRATRMDRADKPLLSLAGRPILAYELDWSAGQAALPAPNVNGQAVRFAAFGLPVLPGRLPDCSGPLAATFAGSQRCLRDCTARHQPRLVVWPAQPDPFVDLNTPDDPRIAEASLAAL